MSTALRAQARKLLGFVAVTAGANEVSVWIVDRPWLASLSTRDPQALLRQVTTGEVIRQVSGGEDERVVFEAEHQNGVVGRARSLTRPTD